MNTKDKNDNNLVPIEKTDAGSANNFKSERGEKNKAFGENVKGSLRDFGISVAATVIGNVAKQGMSLAGKVLEEVGQKSDKTFGERMKEELIDHGWGLIDKLDNDLGDRQREFEQNLQGDLSERFGSDFGQFAGAANDIMNRQTAMQVARNMRRTMETSDTKRDAGLVFPEDVRSYTDIRYGKDPRWNLLDVYRPYDLDGKGKELKKIPVIVNVHGGAWIYGDKETYRFYCAGLAQRGFAVINYSYRLAPEHRFPCALNDTNSVFTWITEHSTEYGLDLNNVFIMGDSAGANIAGQFICMLINKEYAANYDFKPPAGLKINAAAFNCGAYDPLKFMGEKELMKGLVTLDETPIRSGILNVSDYINKDFPPTYLMSCVGDFCFKFLEPMKEALSKYNIEHLTKIYGSEEEPLFHVFHLTVGDEIAEEVNDRECSFFRNYITRNRKQGTKHGTQ